MAERQTNLPTYLQTRFNEIKSELSTQIDKIGFSSKSIPFVPISVEHGDNMVAPSDKMSWFGGWTTESKGGHASGKTLLEAIDAIQPPADPKDLPLRLPVQDVFKIGGVGTVAVGQVQTGTIKPGMVVTFAPAQLTTVVYFPAVYNIHRTQAVCARCIVIIAMASNQSFFFSFRMWVPFYFPHLYNLNAVLNYDIQ